MNPRQFPRCFWCEEKTFRRTKDHVIPKYYKRDLDLNGWRRNNIVMACLRCNNERSIITGAAVMMLRYPNRAKGRWPSDRLRLKLLSLLDKFTPLVEAKLSGRIQTFCLQELATVGMAVR